MSTAPIGSTEPSVSKTSSDHLLPADRIPRNSIGLPETLWWDQQRLYLLDQTRLPIEVVAVAQESVEQVFESIRVLRVRGAPAIGVASAYGLLVDRDRLLSGNASDNLRELERRADYLESSRPTAVNLRWAVRRMVDVAKSLPNDPDAWFRGLEEEAISIHQEDRRRCQQIGDQGASLIRDGTGVLTHCNAGSLATSEFGTATAPMYVAHAAGKRFTVYVDETRPLLQGSRLTAWELTESGIDTRLICDNMAASLMAAGQIDLVIVGTDRVTLRGDVANKIGTLGVAILARHFDIPFYVAMPGSTLDPELQLGRDIVIEQRSPDEVRHVREQRIAPAEVPVCNPAFDVTPAELVTGFITETGIQTPPLSLPTAASVD